MTRVLLTEEEKKARKNARNKAWALANPEKIKAKDKAWRLANLERCRVNKNTWRLANREKDRARSKAWRLTNPDKMKELVKSWKLSNPDKVKAAARVWALANPDKVRARTNRTYRKASDNLTDKYVRGILTYNLKRAGMSIIVSNEIMRKAVEAKRNQLLTYRTLKEI